MFKVTITMGREFDKSGEEVVLDAKAVESIIAIETDICKAFGGYTKTRHLGGYAYEEGNLVEEQSLSISFITEQFKMGELESFAERFKAVYNQESVMLTIENVKINRFI